MVTPKMTPLEKIKPAEWNPRLLRDDRFQKLCKSMEEEKDFLWCRPIIANKDGTIIGGNMRYRAAQHLKWTEIPVSFIDVSDIQAKKLAILDNGQFGEWTDELAEIINELQEAGVDIETLGLDDKELQKVIQQLEPEVVEDEAPPVPETPKSKLGDLYQLGSHRLLCGDATKIEDVERLMDGQKADMWLTDPPYNVEYTGKTKDALKIENDSMDDESFRQFLRDAYATADMVMKQGAVFYIWHADSEGYNFRGACRDVGWTVRQCLVWKKQTLVMGRQDYHWKHEPCLYGWKDCASHLWATDRKQTTILEFDRPSRSGEHPTMKPVALLGYQVGNNTKGEDIVLDSFLGSGTTLIACEQLGRRCFGMELDPRYIDVIVKRWENLTGKTAKLL